MLMKVAAWPIAVIAGLVSVAAFAVLSVQVTPSVLEATEKRSPINTNLLPVHNMAVAKLPSVAHAVDAMLD